MWQKKAIDSQFFAILKGGPEALFARAGIGTSILICQLFVVLLGGCTIKKEPLSRSDLIGESQKDRHFLFGENQKVPAELTLAEALARALKHNLDHRVKMMEESLALGQLQLDKHDLLPDLITNAGYADRSNANASNSVDAITNAQSASNPSYSSDRAINTADLTISWNILDFGISYFSAKQDADRALIASERRRKAMHNLVREVRFAYWRAAAAQALHATVRKTIQMAEKALNDAHTVASEGLKKPLEALRYQKTLLENIRQLENVSQQLATAHIELAALINVPPSTKLNVKKPPSILRPPTIDLSIEAMEEIAFQDNPEIREQSYHSRIAIKETRKAILSLLPGISLTGGRHFDGNDLLHANRWFEWSSKLTWNVLNILNARERIEHAKTGEHLAITQRLALRMAILAQVHVAKTQFQNAGKRFKRANQLSKIDAWIAELMVKRQEADAQSLLDRVSDETSSITSELRRYQAYAELEAAFGQVHATLGIDIVPQKLVQTDLKTLAFSIEKILNKLEKGKLIRSHLASLRGTNKIYSNISRKPTFTKHLQITADGKSKEPAITGHKHRIDSLKSPNKKLLMDMALTEKRGSITEQNQLAEPKLTKDLLAIRQKLATGPIEFNSLKNPWEPVIFEATNVVTLWAAREKYWVDKKLNGNKLDSPNFPYLAVASPE